MGLIDAIFAALLDAGLPVPQVGVAGALLNNYVIAFAMDEQHFTDHLDGPPREAGVPPDDMQTFLAESPPEAFPTFRRLTATANPMSRDEEFEFGLDVLLGGYGLMVARDAPEPKPQ